MSVDQPATWNDVLAEVRRLAETVARHEGAIDALENRLVAAQPKTLRVTEIVLKVEA